MLSACEKVMYVSKPGEISQSRWFRNNRKDSCAQTLCISWNIKIREICIKMDAQNRAGGAKSTDRMNQ